MSPQFHNGRAAASGGGFGPYLQLSRANVLRMRIAAAASVGVAAAGGVGVLHHHHRQRHHPARKAAVPVQQLVPSGHQGRVLLPRGLAEVICGAMGEIVQVICLYPLDTIKVRCQATSSSAAKVVAEMMRAHGGPLSPALWRQLYAGAVGASLLSVGVGALYFSSFCAAKRHLLRWTADGERRDAARAAAAGAADALPAAAAGAAAVAADPSHHHHHHHLHGPSVDYHHDAIIAMVCSDDKAAALANGREGKRAQGDREGKRRRKEAPRGAADGSGADGGAAAQRATVATPTLDADAQPSYSAAAAAAAAPAALAAQAAAGSDKSASSSGDDAMEESVSGGGRLRANLAAAVFAALVGAVVEAPVELFKHQLQAGHISGSILGAMGGAVRTGGGGALFRSLLPFCTKSLPFDSSELLTYSSLSDARDELIASAAGTGMDGAPSGSGGGAQGLKQRLASTARDTRDSPFWDCAMGALAGGVAVVVSQPMDTIKTCIEVGAAGGGAAAGGAAAAGAAGGAAAAAVAVGPLAAARVFGDTGRRLVAQHGVGALFAGMGMRLAEQVPSTALYWITVEYMRRALEPYVAK